MDAKEWEQMEKRQLITNIGVDAYERLRYAQYLTRLSIGQIITILVNEHLEEPPKADPTYYEWLTESEST